MKLIVLSGLEYGPCPFDEHATTNAKLLCDSCRLSNVPAEKEVAAVQLPDCVWIRQVGETFELPT